MDMSMHAEARRNPFSREAWQIYIPVRFEGISVYFNEQRKIALSISIINICCFDQS